jgi:hypothetical protein
MQIETLQGYMPTFTWPMHGRQLSRHFNECVAWCVVVTGMYEKRAFGGMNRIVLIFFHREQYVGVVRDLTKHT